jgi:hypothetical protein
MDPTLGLDGGHPGAWSQENSWIEAGASVTGTDGLRMSHYPDFSLQSLEGWPNSIGPRPGNMAALPVASTNCIPPLVHHNISPVLQPLQQIEYPCTDPSVVYPGLLPHASDYTVAASYNVYTDYSVINNTHANQPQAVLVPSHINTYDVNIDANQPIACGSRLSSPPQPASHQSGHGRLAKPKRKTNKVQKPAKPTIVKGPIQIIFSAYDGTLVEVPKKRTRSREVIARINKIRECSACLRCQILHRPVSFSRYDMKCYRSLIRQQCDPENGLSCAQCEADANKKLKWLPCVRPDFHTVDIKALRSKRHAYQVHGDIC